MKTLRHLHLVGATGQIRTAVYDNREHLVVPVVAMVEGVVWAINSDVPEMVPAEELAETPQQWNGRHCFAGHPEDGGSQVTANTPRTLETSFGTVFGASSRDLILSSRRLEVLAYLDPAKAGAVGPDAVDVITRLRAGETVEVSVGCYVEAEDVDGEFNGKTFHGRWTNIVSDHLAFLAAGEQGACSVAAGCGAGRRATRHVISAEGIRREEEMATVQRPPNQTPAPSEEMKKRSLKDRLKGMLRTLETPVEEVAEETTEMIGYAVMQSLIGQAVVTLGEARGTVDALMADETAEGTGDEDAEEAIEDARLDALRTQCMAVYSLLGGVMDMCWEMQREEADDVQAVYVVNAAKRVLADAGKKVDPSVLLAKIKDQFKALGATTCACGGHPRQSTSQPGPKEVIMKDAVKKVISESGGKYTEADATWLDAVPDAHLEALAVKPTAPVPVVAAAKPPTRDEMLAAMPDVKAILDERVAKDAADKSALETSLLTCGVKTVEELKATSLSELRTMALFAKVAAPAVDYSGLGAPRVPPAAEDFTPPDPYADGLKALRESVN